ncbi:hypothetical protein KDA_56810 [Dictyobacter alpinus]|uniref:Uncharacterized protein n=1 Tax=Dictyobacter alpinus TaxID=2014873 RepID=A0A402BG03_9CHLR|nr:hypothetical protein KDA_56810 [Dictyobacter alpinus]
MYRSCIIAKKGHFCLVKQRAIFSKKSKATTSIGEKARRFKTMQAHHYESVSTFSLHHKYMK